MAKNPYGFRHIKYLFNGILALLLSCTSTFSQDIRFNHITTDEGFGIGYVWSFLQDHEGFMWFATEDGLIRYDGYELRYFRHDKSDSTTISTNFAMSLLEDKYHQLWIGTFGGGLNRYDRTNNVFYHYEYDTSAEASISRKRVKSLLESKDGKIWMGTEGQGVYFFDPAPVSNHNLTFVHFDLDPHEIEEPNATMIRSIAEDSLGNLYIGSLNGISIIDSERKKISIIKAGDAFPNALSSNLVLEVMVDSKQRVWIGTIDSGLNLYLPEKQQIVHYYPSNQPNTLMHPEIETIVEDQNGNIWVGSDNGLSKLNDNTNEIPRNEFTNYQHEPLDENSLLSNPIKSLYVDSRNALWVGSYYGGINVYNPGLYKFIPIRNKQWIHSSLNNNNVTAFAEDKNHNVWVGTDGGGLSLLVNAFQNIYADNYIQKPISRSGDHLPETKVKTLRFDHDGILWIGYWAGGLFSYDPVSGHQQYYGPNDMSGSGLVGIRVLDIDVDKANNVWVATFDKGVACLNRVTGKFKNYLQNESGDFGIQGDRFNAILIDSQNRIWAGGDLGGLNLFNSRKDCFERIEVDTLLNRNISILSLAELQNGKILIGTVANGIITYNPTNREVQNYSEDSGLLNNVVHASIEDDKGNIWVSTNQGITVIYTDSGKIQNFTRNDGLQGNQFNNGSSLMLSNGMILFGGINGWNAFFPDNIQKSNRIDPIVFTRLEINGAPPILNNERQPIVADLNLTDRIVLNFNQRSLNFEFALLDYNFSHSTHYQYFLEEFDKEWQYIGTDRKAVYTNLDPGSYELRVKARSQDGFWNERPMKLQIIINPAWWQTKVFQISALAILVLITYLAFRIRLSFLIKQRVLLEKVVQSRTSELRSANLELSAKNDEIQAQVEELSAQNEQIILQREELENTKTKLQQMNELLETKVTQRTKKLEMTVKELDKTVNELDRFVYSASHDLSSPLKSIRGLIQIARLDSSPSELNKCLDHMDYSINNLDTVIKSMVDYSRNTHLEVIKVPINCYDLINEVKDELLYWPEAKNVQIENIHDKSLVLLSDKSRIKIILHNLIGNGIKYADSDKPNPYVKIECMTTGEGWVMKVSDNGIGIGIEHLDNIFQMYYRASEKSKGSGLGLFIVKESVSKLKGYMHVVSKLGTGTTFTLSFVDKP